MFWHSCISAETMTIIKLNGGLGNQMFQYATARAICDRAPVLLDLFFFTKYKSQDDYTPRSFELGVFENLQAKPLSSFFEKVLYSEEKFFKVLKFFIYSRMQKIVQRDMEYMGSLRRNKGHVYLNGYFQSERYFSKIRNQLLQEFCFPVLDTENLSRQYFIQSVSTSVSIHVRRGDYLKPHNNKVHGILPLRYYTKAISNIEQQVENPYYFIFSDDPNWCEKNFNFLSGKFTIITNNDSSTAWKDMCLMTKCNHHIIANSSFSWWGAWLSTFDKKIVVAPQKWYAGEERNKYSEYIIPQSWIRL